jgi:hypothetical protein
VEIGDAVVATQEQTAPDHRTDVPQDHLELVNGPTVGNPSLGFHCTAAKNGSCRLERPVFYALQERDKDQVCRDFGVDREYLRVLLHRAKQSFKALYLRNTGNDSPEFTPA